MENIDFEQEVSKIGGKDWTIIAAIVVGLIAIIVVGLLAASLLNSGPVSITFDQPKVKAGGNTQIKVTVVNTGEIDATSVTVQIAPESPTLTIANPLKVEPVIGAKSKRQFTFPIIVTATATPGTYKVTATVTNIGIENAIAIAYLEVE